MLHPQGQNRSQDPIGLSNRIKRRKGCIVFGDFSTMLEVLHHGDAIEWICVGTSLLACLHSLRNRLGMHDSLCKHYAKTFAGVLERVKLHKFKISIFGK